MPRDTFLDRTRTQRDPYAGVQLRQQIYLECRAMAEFALAKGKSIPAGTVTTIESFADEEAESDGNLISLCGGENVFAGRRDRRYPRVSEDEIVAAAPEVVLLPDEPYAFGPRDAAELGRLPLPAAASGRVHLIDGTLVSWYGPRIGRAIQTLRPLLRGRG